MTRRLLRGARRVLVVAAVLGVFTGFTLDLRAGELARADERLSKCAQVPDSVLDAIESRLNERAGGTLHYGFTVSASDQTGAPWMVSAQLRRPGRPRQSPGHILTWTTADPQKPSDDYASVDENARDFSDWSRSPLPVTVSASIDSRACVHETRPGRKGLFH